MVIIVNATIANVDSTCILNHNSHAHYDLLGLQAQKSFRIHLKFVIQNNDSE